MKTRWMLVPALALVAMLALPGCATSTAAPTAVAAEAPAAPTTAPAEKFPTRAVTIVHMGSAGGGLDTMVRGIQPYLSEALGVPVLIEPLSGSGGVKSRNRVYELPADGYTILGDPSTALMYSAVNHEAELFDKYFETWLPVCSWQNADGNPLVTKKGGSIATLDDFVKVAKQRKVTVALGGPYGSGDHAIALMIKNELKLDNMQIIPFAGGGESGAAVLGGVVDAGLMSLSATSFDPTAMNVLGVDLERRSDIFPDIPTFKELGYPQLEIGYHVGAWVKKGTPQDRIGILEAAFKKAFDSPGFQKWAKDGKKPIGDFYGAKKWGEYMLAQDKKVSAIIPLLIADMKKAQ